jgi:acyl dehydratase
MNLEQLTTIELPEIRASYTRRDTMLYALGVGACRDPLNPDELKFVYESALQTLPSLSCVVAHPGAWIVKPELAINYVKLVHAEQYFQLAAPLLPEGDLIGRYRVTGVVDKGAQSGALVYFEKSLHRTDGTFVGTVESSYFLRGDGGCGNWGQPGRELPAIPASPPSGTVEIPSLPIAALIYRLSGDYNPLHADPVIAKKAGFEKPILHGLCTYGIACHSLIRALCPDDASRLTSMGARFTKPVYPGDTIRTEYWTSGDGKVQFRSTSVQRNEVVLDRGTASIKI